MFGAVDVAICAYGKPFQTAVTLASLFQHSGHHIDTVYFQEEAVQPYGDSVRQVLSCFPGRRFVHFVPQRFLSWHMMDRSMLHDTAFRHSIRYQRAWEECEKDHLFISHNDCLYSSDIVGQMLGMGAAGEVTGVGWIGQCWNCPAYSAGLCSSEIFPRYRPTYDELRTLLAAYPDSRSKFTMVNPEHPLPPECRLNEFACLINLAACRHLVMPYGQIVPFGFMEVDVGMAWFRELWQRGHRFLNCRDFHHAPFSSAANGHAADLAVDEYESSELKARAYLEARYPDVAARLGQTAL